MLKIKREEGWADKLRNYKVVLDSNVIGSIGQKGTFEYPLNPGIHTLYLKIDWCRSNKIEFEVRDNEIVSFTCGGLKDVKFLVTIWYITFGWNKYLWIKQLEA